MDYKQLMRKRVLISRMEAKLENSIEKAYADTIKRTNKLYWWEGLAESIYEMIVHVRYKMMQKDKKEARNIDSLRSKKY